MWLLVRRCLAIPFFVLAFYIWISYHYQVGAEYWPMSILDPGAVSQGINWVTVCLVALPGAFLWGKNGRS